MTTTIDTTKATTKENAAAHCRAYAAANPGTVFHNYATHKCVRTADNRTDLYRWFKLSADYTRTRPELKGLWVPSTINAEVAQATAVEPMHGDDVILKSGAEVSDIKRPLGGTWASDEFAGAPGFWVGTLTKKPTHGRGDCGVLGANYFFHTDAIKSIPTATRS